MRLRVLLLCLLVGGCATRRPPRRCACPCPCPTVARAPAPAEPIEDAETLYYAVLALRPDVVRLRSIVDDDAAHPLVRGAAARVLCDAGKHEAAWRLIANLHRDQRTYVTVDAIHHLEQVFGETLDYDANLGYRHQTEKLAAWVRWYAARFPQSAQLATLQALVAQRDESDVPAPTPVEQLQVGSHEGKEDAAFLAAWRWLAERAKSRDPRVVASVEAGFAALLKRRPNDALLMNNYALAALNNGNWDAALQQYRRAVARPPKDAQLHNDIGILLEGMGDLPGAQAAYERAHVLGLGDVAAANLADVHRKQGRSEEARRYYAEAEKLAPDKWYYHRLWTNRLP